MRVCSRLRDSRGWLISKTWIGAAIFFALATSSGSAQTTTNYSLVVRPGYNSIANHFIRGQNLLADVIPTAPSGSELYKWNSDAQTYYLPPARFLQGVGWAYQQPEAGYLKPGEGAFLHVTVNATLTFSGATGYNPFPRQVVVGAYNFISGQEPRTMSFPEVFGFGPLPGDVVYMYDIPVPALPDTNQQGASSIHKFTASQGWDIVPTFQRGRSAFVYLSDAPRITMQPLSQIVNAGQTVQLTVSAIGAAPLQYQWQLNDDDLPGETNPFLMISNAQFWNSGAYSVVVANQLGTTTSKPAFVRVNSRPVILDQPQPVLTVPGAKVSFDVRATGTPILRYQWFRDNAPVSGATQPTYVIDSAQQSGQYFVRVSNDLGFAQSQAVPLTIIIPPQIISQPVSQTAGVGQTVSFRVVAEGTQPLTYHWRHNGQRIPWGTNATLVVSNVLPRDAGTYDVAVANAIGAAHSDPALLFLNVPPIFLSDKITGAELYTMPAFTGRGDNLRAGNEPNEVHCGRIGGSSVWLRWMAREPGIVRFETSGSSFDTVMAAYVIDREGRQIEVACDDDEGAFFGSRIQFAAVPDTIYYIAIDGLDGARGHIILDWALEPTLETLPLIILQPQDQTANFGDQVLFTVKVEPPPGVALRFQWYHDGLSIEGADGPELLVPFQSNPPRGIDQDDVGYYYVEILANDKRLVRSRRALLEISLADANNRLLYAFAVDKFADAFDRSQGHFGGVQSVDTVGFAPVLGYTGTQIFSTVAFSGEPGELSHCGIPGGSSAWFSFIPAASGRLYLDTAGSSFNTVLAVYTGPGPTIATLKALVCDDDSGPGTTSSLNFQANNGTVYYIAVDGKNGVTGTAHLNYRLLVPMSLTDIVKTNDTICGFRVNATPSYPFTIQRCAGFSSWTTMLTTNSPTGMYDYYDTNAVVQKRFYRALQTP